MTNSNNNALWATLAVISLLLGAILGASLMYLSSPTKIDVQKEIVLQNVSVEVPGETIQIEVPADLQAEADSALDLFISEIEDDDVLMTCSGVEYDADQVAVKSLDKDYTILVDDEDKTVSISVKLKYLDSDVEEKCYNTYDVTVLYEDGEDPVVSYI